MADESKAREVGPLEHKLHEIIMSSNGPESPEELALLFRVIARAVDEQERQMKHYITRIWALDRRVKDLEQHDHGGEVLTAPGAHDKSAQRIEQSIAQGGALPEHVWLAAATGGAPDGPAPAEAEVARDGYSTRNAPAEAPSAEAFEAAVRRCGTGVYNDVDAPIIRTHVAAKDTEIARLKRTVADREAQAKGLSRDLDVQIGAKREARAEVARLVDRLRGLENFFPTPEQVNALPEGVRRYVADLETRCDPAGDVAALVLVRDQNKMLEAEVARLKALPAQVRLQTVPVPPDRRTPEETEAYWIVKLAEKIRETVKLEADLAEARKERDKARKEIATDNKLLAERDSLLAMPELQCPEHGACVPFAMERVRKLAEAEARLAEALKDKARIDKLEAIKTARGRSQWMEDWPLRPDAVTTWREAIDALPEPPVAPTAKAGPGPAA